MNDVESLKGQVRELTLLVNELRTQQTIIQSDRVLPTTVETPNPPVQAVNQIRNGELAHSINTWSDSSPAGNNRDYECIYWYSHTVPTASQQLLENTNPLAANNSIKTSSDSFYDATYTDWDKTNGYARLNGTASLDTPIYGNSVIPGQIMYAVFSIAKANAYIDIPSDAFLYAGIWDNTSGQRNWIQASAAFTLTGSVVGSPTGTTSRKYKVLARTDKGISWLSNELTLASAPDNSSFVANSVYVSLSWDTMPGVIAYDIYRLTGATYEWLYSITNGTTSYNDQNSVLDGVAGYPTATDTYNKAYTTTNTTEFTYIATDGVSAGWTQVELPIPVSALYNQSLTTDRQWLRIGMSKAADMKISGCTTNATTTVNLPSSLLTASHVGLTVFLDDGTNTATRTISAQAGNSLTLSSSVSWSNSTTTITITGGGFFGVLVDKLHLSYAPGAIFSPHRDDGVTAQIPASRPNGSSQGGVGIGGDGSGDGGIRCLWGNEQVLIQAGNQRYYKKVKECRIGECFVSGNLQPNVVIDFGKGKSDIYRVKTRNGWAKFCTLTHRLITSAYDHNGTMLKRLKVGDIVLTDCDGRIEASALTEIELFQKDANVIFFRLAPGKTFVSGHWEGSLWQRIRNRFLGINQTGGILDHNLKEIGLLDTA